MTRGNKEDINITNTIHMQAGKQTHRHTHIAKKIYKLEDNMQDKNPITLQYNTTLQDMTPSAI